MNLLLSSQNKETTIEALNKFFYSTTYNINENNTITWKGGEIKENLILKISKGRFKVYQK